MSPQLRFRHSPTTHLASNNSSAVSHVQQISRSRRRDEARSICSWTSILPDGDTLPMSIARYPLPPRPGPRAPRPARPAGFQLRYGPCPSRASPVVPSPAKSERCFFLVGQTARRPLTGQRQQGGEPWLPDSLAVPWPWPDLTDPWQHVRSLTPEWVFAELDASIDFVLTGPRQQPCPPFGCQSQRR